MDRTPVGTYFRNCPDRPWGPHNLLYNGYRVLPGVKHQGRGVNHPPSSSAEVKERAELYLYSPCRLTWPGLGSPLPLGYKYPEYHNTKLYKRENNIKTQFFFLNQRTQTEKQQQIRPNTRDNWDRIPLGSRFLLPSKGHPACCAMGTWSFPELKRLKLVLTTHLFLMSGCEGVGATALPSSVPVKGIGKAFPLRAWTGPWGYWGLRLQISRQLAHEGGEVVSPTHRPSLPPGKIPGTYIC